jgi:hypothetical protein
VSFSAERLAQAAAPAPLLIRGSNVQLVACLQGRLFSDAGRLTKALPLLSLSHFTISKQKEKGRIRLESRLPEGDLLHL